MNTETSLSINIHTLFVCRENNGKISPFIQDQKEALESRGVSVDVFTVRGNGIKGYLKSLKALQAKLKKGSYDFIHAHYGLSGLLACLQLKVPVVITLHGSDVNQPKIRVFSKMASLMAQKVIVVSEKMKSLLKSKEDKTAVIPCGVDMERFRPMATPQARKKLEARGKLQFKKDKKYVLFSSSLDVEVKNPELAMDALQALGDKYELIELKGYSREEVALLFNAVDVALLTSYTEGSPQFIKEAMACNCPLVSTPVGDVREIINDTEGCFISSATVEEISRNIRKASTFRRTQGRVEMPEEYREQEVIDKIISSYKEILERLPAADRQKTGPFHLFSTRFLQSLGFTGQELTELWEVKEIILLLT
jgi:teichuronic acid biosynthesis glycosyltransferase TuaC